MSTATDVYWSLGIFRNKRSCHGASGIVMSIKQIDENGIQPDQPVDQQHQATLSLSHLLGRMTAPGTEVAYLVEGSQAPRELKSAVC